MTSYIIFNDKLLPANKACFKYNDRGLTLGHGLYETIRIEHNQPIALQYHWQRLQKSAKLLGLSIPFDFQHMQCTLKKLIQANHAHTPNGIRITLTDGESGRGLLSDTPSSPNAVISTFLNKIIKKQMSACIVSHKKNETALSSRVKSISCIDNIMAKQEAVKQGYDEAILLNNQSNIADGALSNIFIVKNNQIYTPPISDGALPGIVRRIILEKLAASFTITEKSLSVAETLTADELFITNALLGIMPIEKLNQTHYKNNPITKKLRHAFDTVLTTTK